MEVLNSGVGKNKRKLTALPLLVALFVLSYSLLTRLVIDQDRTIDAQSSMIHSLLRDNIALSKFHKHVPALPKHLFDRNDLQVEFESPAAAAPQQRKAPSNQVQLDQFPSAQVLQHQAPSNQVKAGSQANTKIAHRPRKAAKPVSPPAPLTDPSDMRRVIFSI
ncbi:MAG TPA: hypothetical protein VJO35_13865 [Terriglobales bacterium]|nr:hypothetical protein [Terriglobales bacterium]